MKAQKLPSGHWRYQCRRTLKDGTSERLSVTFERWEDRRKAEAACREWQAEAKLIVKHGLTVAQAVAEYIAKKEAGGKSPATIRGYRAIERSALGQIGRIRVERLTEDDLQEVVDAWADDGLSPKTIRNRHGLILAAVCAIRRGFSPHVDLPSPVPPDIHAPSAGEVVELLRAVHGTRLEIPVLLAAFGPMRRGEICALDGADVEGRVVHVRHALARSDGGRWVLKQPKSAAGVRDITYPQEVINLLPRSGRVCPMSPDDLTRAMAEAVDSLGLEHFTLHGLRHFAASQCHAMGIPDAYTANRAGWSRVHVMRQHYTHVLPPEEARINEQINTVFANIIRAAV